MPVASKNGDVLALTAGQLGLKLKTQLGFGQDMDI
jgi:hypothetical protein